MSGAILQGVPATTLDTDLWIDLPERQYMRTINLALRLGAQMIRQTVVALSDGSLVNFLYRVDGLASFGTEWRRAAKVPWHGSFVKVVPLESIIRSKEYIRREKDIAHLPLLKSVLAARKLTRGRR
jgi:predicted alpha-1,6-mannanase (GH76 family)